MNDYGYGLWALVVFNSLLFIVLIMVGFLLQWPTFATLAMFPILLVVHQRLATREERDVRAEFGAAYDAHVLATPRFLPRLRDLDGGSDAPQAGGLPR